MRKKKIDLIAQKEREAKELNERSERAVAAVRNSFENMSAVNAEIESRMAEIDAAQHRLNVTKDELGARHTRNQQIIANFKRLLCEDE